MKKLIITLNLISVIVYGASELRYVNSETYTRNKDDYIVYKKNEARKSGINDYIGLFDGTIDLDNVRKLAGIPFPKVWYFPGAENEEFQKVKKDKSSDNHLSSMFRAFIMMVGNDWGSQNYGRLYTSSLQGENQAVMPYGIAQSSLAITNNYSGHLTSQAPYYGNVINEMSALPMTGRRMLDEDYTENGNLFIQAMENETPINTVKLQKNTSGTKSGLVNIDNYTAVSSGYGIEAQKLMRAESIHVIQEICGGWGRGWEQGGNYKNSWKNVTTQSSGETTLDFLDKEKKLRNGKLAKMVEHGYAKNECVLSSEKTDIASLPLLSRAHTVVANGQVWNGNRVTNGTSFAAPKIAGLAAKIQEKFPGMSYHQIKQLILTTANRTEDRLSSFIGWGTLNETKALNGPSMLNAGLIEEEKFFTGMYDKVMAKDGTKFFWAEVPQGIKWKWSNDIFPGFEDKPSGYDTFDTALTGERPDGRMASAMSYASVVEGINIARYVPNEKNFYYDEDDMETRAGLRKAGNGILELNANLRYREVTQILQGKLILNGNSDSELRVFKNATLEINGNRNIQSLIADGGKVSLNGNMTINHFGIDSGDISFSGNITINNLYVKNETEKQKYMSMENLKMDKVFFRDFEPVNAIINNKKVANIKHEYFMNNFSSSPKTTGIYDIDKKEIFTKIRERYKTNADSPNREYIPGYKNGEFTADRDLDTERFNYRYYLGGTMWFMGFSPNLKTTGKDWKMYDYQAVQGKFKKIE